jgi:hypothetical protein
MSIEIGSLYRFKHDPTVVFVVVSCAVQPHIRMGDQTNVYQVKCFLTSGEHKEWKFVTENQLEKLA